MTQTTENTHCNNTIESESENSIPLEAVDFDVGEKSQAITNDSNVQDTEICTSFEMAVSRDEVDSQHETEMTLDQSWLTMDEEHKDDDQSQAEPKSEHSTCHEIDIDTAWDAEITNMCESTSQAKQVNVSKVTSEPSIKEEIAIISEEPGTPNPIGQNSHWT